VRIFVYEHITGGGTLMEGTLGPPGGTLLAEGAAMLRALVADFAAVEGVDVAVLRDARLEETCASATEVRIVHNRTEYQHAFDQLTAESDATIVVAPELRGALLRCCRRVVDLGGTLISPGPSAVECASNKLRVCQRLRELVVPVPRTQGIGVGDPLPHDFPYPAVIKPVDGAGSIDVRLVRSPDDWSWDTNPAGHREWLLEQYHVGTPVSVALLCRPGGLHPLIPCRQRLDDLDTFTYRGGALPLPPPLARRAVRLARQAVGRTLPGVVGFLGVDLVLGGDPSGGEDVVIEINPRVTTSYVGLRAAAETNLAAAMVDVAADRAPDLRFYSESLEFDVDGTVRRG
jgi:predicted ATP-grasp superfamily ATP-dependent carboligase